MRAHEFVREILIHQSFVKFLNLWENVRTAESTSTQKSHTYKGALIDVLALLEDLAIMLEHVFRESYMFAKNNERM